MIAALSAWLNAHLDRMTGEDALIWVGVIACVSTFVGAALVAAWQVWWRDISSRVSRWRVSRVTKPKPWPIRFVERPMPHRDPWPIVSVVAFAALVVAIMWQCGVRR